MLLALTAGARYRYQLLWVLLIVALEKIIFSEFAIRASIKMEDTWYFSMKKRYGAPLSIVAGMLAFLSPNVYVAGNLLGSSNAALLVLPQGVHIIPVAIVILAITIFIFWQRHVYPIIEKIAIAMVFVMLISYLFIVIIVGIHPGEFFRGFLPSSAVFQDSVMMLMAVSVFTSNTSSFSIGLTFLVREKKYSFEEAKTNARLDVYLGLAFFIFVLILLMIAGAEILNPQGLIPRSAQQFATILEPAYGSFARFVFGLGLFGAAYTSLVGTPITLAYTLSDTVGRLDRGADSTFVRVTATLSVLVLGTIVIIATLQGVPMMNIYWLASLCTFITLPINGFVMCHTASNKKIMGELLPPRWMSIVGWVFYAVIILWSSYNIIKSTIIPMFIKS
jgi:Mn2+/Fe2+ NRAMP family transporter